MSRLFCGLNALLRQGRRSARLHLSYFVINYLLKYMTNYDRLRGIRNPDISYFVGESIRGSVGEWRGEPE